MPQSPHPGRVLRLHEWPSLDQALWQEGLLPGDILDGRAYADGLRPTTIRNAARGYGRWLQVLQDTDPAALLLPPTDRATPARARRFLAALQAARNTNNTIKARFWEIRAALRIMRPEINLRWLNYPAGESLHAMLPTTLGQSNIQDIRELAQWGRDLMAEALAMPPSVARAVRYRNGLIIAILANRAPRLRSLATLRWGTGVVRSGDCYRLAFGVADMKGKRRLEYGLHPSLTAPIDHYIEVERPCLQGRRSHGAFWVNQAGNPLGQRGIDGVVRRGSRARFGKAFGPQEFRIALATASMIANPTTPGMIAAVLGNSPAVVEAHYALGGQLEAATQHQHTLEAEREQTRALARQAFG
jgi:hypothetical protein